MAIELDDINFYQADDTFDTGTFNRPLLQLQSNQAELNNYVIDLKTRLVLVSINGPTTVTAGDTYNYQITDYNEWSTYTVSSDLYTVSSVNSSGIFTLTVPVGSPDGAVAITVDRDGIERTVTVSVGSSGVNTPTITSHTDGQTGVNANDLTFISSDFSSYPSGFGELASVEWELYSDSGLTTLIDSKSDATGDMEYTVNPYDVGENQTCYIRLKHIMNNGDESDWVLLQFTTVAEFGITPNQDNVSFVEIDAYPISGYSSLSSSAVYFRTAYDPDYLTGYISVGVVTGSGQSNTHSRGIFDVNENTYALTSTGKALSTMTRPGNDTLSYGNYAYSKKHNLSAYSWTYSDGECFSFITNGRNGSYSSAIFVSSKKKVVNSNVNGQYSFGFFVDHLDEFHHIATSQNETTVYVYDVNTFTIKAEYNVNVSYSTGYISFDGFYVTSIFDGTLEKFSVENYQLRSTYNVGQGVDMVDSLTTPVSMRGYRVVHGKLWAVSDRVSDVGETYKQNYIIFENS